MVNYMCKYCEDELDNAYKHLDEAGRQLSIKQKENSQLKLALEEANNKIKELEKELARIKMNIIASNRIIL